LRAVEVSRSSNGASTCDQADYEEDQENDEENLGYPSSGSSDTAESEHGCDQRNYQKNPSVM
jgi:hypothetical protein